MRQTITSIVFLLISTAPFAQADFEPQILVLAPGNIRYDKIFEKEIEEFNRLMKQNSALAKQEGSYRERIFKSNPSTSGG